MRRIHRNPAAAAAFALALLTVLFLVLAAPRVVPIRPDAPLAARALLGPTIQGESPGNGETIGTMTPTIMVTYTSVNLVRFVDFHLDGMNLTSAGTFNQTSFVLPLALELRDGLHVANFTAVDMFGATGFENWTFTVDTVAPILIVTSPTYPVVPSSAVFVNGTASIASSYFVGALPINVSVTVLPSEMERWTVLPQGGPFSLLVVLTEGVNTLFVNATDRVGNRAVQIVNVVSDTVKPPLVVLTPANLSVSPTSVVRFSGLSQFGVYLYVNGVNVAVLPNGTWSVDLAFPDGVQVVPVTATDLAGNTNVSVIVVLVDSDVPQVTLTSPLYPVSNRSTVVVSGLATDSRLAAILVNGISVAFSPSTGAFTTTLTLPDGLQPIVVVAVDAGLHRGVAKSAVLVDTTPPAVRVNDPLNGLETNQSTVVVDGTVDDVNATVIVNGQDVRPNPGGSWRTTVALVVGSNTIRVSAVDEAGNRAANVVRTVTYTAPWPELSQTVQDNWNAFNRWVGWLGLGLVAILLVILVVVLAMYVRFNARVLKMRPARDARAHEEPKAAESGPPKEAPPKEGTEPPK